MWQIEFTHNRMLVAHIDLQFLHQLYIFEVKYNSTLVARSMRKFTELC